MAIKRLKRVRGNHLSYFQGFGTGIITALTASALLGAFFWLLGGISKAAVEQIQARNLFGSDLGVLIGGLGIILLGTMTGVITSLVAMQYYKNADEQPVASDKAVCFSVCEAGQAATVKIKAVDVPSSMQTAPVTCFPALTVMVVDPNDRSTLPVRAPWCELPASIRFLRLTI